MTADVVDAPESCVDWNVLTKSLSLNVVARRRLAIATAAVAVGSACAVTAVAAAAPAQHAPQVTSVARGEVADNTGPQHASSMSADSLRTMLIPAATSANTTTASLREVMLPMPQAVTPPPPPPAPVDNSPRGIARRIVPSEQFAAFDQIITRESGWNPRAQNPSGAYGLGQALPGGKMASAGPDWHDNPETQLRWTYQYMNSRYGSPNSAWSFWQSHHWY